jgi:hypothetical protein
LPKASQCFKSRSLDCARDDEDSGTRFYRELRRWGIGAALLALALAVSAGCLRAADQPIDRESLRALDGIRVVVEDLPSGAPTELNKDALKRSVESKLAAAHIPVLNSGEYPVGDPFLRVKIKMTPESGGLVAYHVELDFAQIVFIRRNPQQTFNRAQTWAADARMGLVARKQLAERVQKDLDAQVDQFTAAYLSVNPK